jgi:aldose 1-epimerase
MSELTVTEQPFGSAPDGTPVHRWVLGAPGGFSIAVLTYGAILHSCRVPQEDGNLAETVLSLPSVRAYAEDHAYVGAVIGRYANRIAQGRFILDGTTYLLPRNEGPHTLHGGPDGFHRRVWSASGFRTSNSAGVVLRLRSPDMDMGFPGILDAEVVYRVNRAGTLAVATRVRTDRATVVNLTHHAYWNLANDGTIVDHELTVEADAYLPTDSSGIPLGHLEPTGGTPFALGRPFRDILQDRHPDIVTAGGVDHCFALRGGCTATPRPAARLVHPGTRRAMEVWTTEPGLQVYTGNQLGQPYPRHGGVCLEAQHFPDAPNRPSFPSTVLRPGHIRESVTGYRFGPAADSGPGASG